MTQSTSHAPKHSAPEVRSGADTVPSTGIWRDKFGLRLWVRLVIAALVVVATISLSGGLNSHDTYLYGTLAAWALIASSLNLVVGYAGQLNLSSGAFLALGAYIGVLGTGRYDWPGWKSLLIAGLIALAFSLLLGLVIFRARGLHFALITAGISIIGYNVALLWKEKTGGAAGISSAGPIEEGGIARPFVLGPIELSQEVHYLRAMVVVLVVMLLATSVLVRRKLGLSWQATRDDEVLAASVGVRVARSKRTAFAASSVLISLVGVLYGHWLGFITPGSFDFATAAFEPLAMVIIGGAGTLLGPMVGALVVVGFPELFNGLKDYSTLVYAALLLLVVMVAPKGVVGVVESTWRRVRRGKRPSEQEKETER
ncbi:branched-chain amino acid ABC transporter permease [Nocardioides sp. AE5]|uniref:branched-chain amino acid ABC transporter permease n=1 Tax=Nocardioides sp. AE5 TaxID=2962573 RepID=UPI0028819686|nr:branched-chain amino acid ABC transporter permease [Nocardioides sp. AE5]MDT0202720.1 branched-chain amino acid ABC transporter permease [Nocardioides sp. AE5]